MSEYTVDFSGPLRKILEERGDGSRSWLARETGLSVATISRLANKDEEQQIHPSLTTMVSISLALKCSLDDLVDLWEE